MKILITGARSGIGYLAALDLAEKGHRVYLTVHTEKQLESLKDKTEVLRNKITCLKLDITNKKDRNSVKNLDIDILINNAAIGNGGSIIDNSIDVVRDNFEVNFFGTIQMTQLYLKSMINKNQGRIIIISSLAGEIPLPWMGIYSSTKAALNSLFTSLRLELKKINSDVKIVIIEPGFYHTGFNKIMMDKKYDDDSFFKNLSQDILNEDNLKLNLLESKDLASIVNTISKACLVKKPRNIYKVPLFQALLEKAYVIKNK